MLGCLSPLVEDLNGSVALCRKKRRTPTSTQSKERCGAHSSIQGRAGGVSEGPNRGADRTMSAKKTELLSETAYQAIRSMIVAHRFTPGVRVNVEKLGRELGISRSPVWEAIRRLEQEGVLSKIANRGVFMIENTLEKLFEQVQIRGPLDALAARLACSRISERDLSRLSRLLADQLDAMEIADLTAYSSSDLQFHRLIYGASGNVSLRDLFESIILQMTTPPSRLDILSRLPLIFASHQQMLEGLRDRDEERVRLAVERHTDIILSHLEAEIRLRTERQEAIQDMKERFGSSYSRVKKGRQEK
jgi:DNA-binding GntR family transcriptional regulator